MVVSFWRWAALRAGGAYAGDDLHYCGEGGGDDQGFCLISTRSSSTRIFNINRREEFVLLYTSYYDR